MALNNKDPIKSMLALAIHPTTPHAEAWVAILKLLEWAEKRGITLGNLVGGKSVGTPIFDGIISVLLTQIAHLNGRLRGQEPLEVKITELTAKLAARDAEIAKLRSASTSVPDENVPCYELEEAAKALIVPGSRASWKSAVAFELGESLAHIGAYVTLGKVPRAHVDTIRQLTELKGPDRTRWTPEQIWTVRELARQGQSPLDIARVVSGRFGRRTFESGITRLLTQIARGQRDTALAEHDAVLARAAAARPRSTKRLPGPPRRAALTWRPAA